MNPHPICALFPMLDAGALAELAEDIRQHGQREPVVHLDGVLLDGRNRLLACELAGVEPELSQWHGNVAEIPAWILSKNLHRRHLTTSQRAMIAAELATLQLGSNQHTRVGQLADPPTQTEAARLLQVGERTVRRAREVLDSGDAELVDQVRRGELAVSAAAEQVRAALDGSPTSADAPGNLGGGGSIPPRPTDLDEGARAPGAVPADAREHGGGSTPSGPTDLAEARRRWPLDQSYLHIPRIEHMPADVQARPRCDRSGRPIGSCDCTGCCPPQPRRESVIGEAERIVAGQVAEFEARHTDPIDLRCASCADVDWPTGDLVIADPPWSYVQKHGASRADNHYSTLPTSTIVEHLAQFAKLAPRMALWITWPLLGEWERATRGWPWGAPVTGGAWLKSGPAQEPDDEDEDRDPAEYGTGHYGQGYHWAGCSEPVLIYTSCTAYTDRGAPLRNAWQWSPSEHSAKPVEWQRQWIERWVPELGRVLDPYAGLGTVASATRRAGGGRLYVGTEIDPARHAAALERLRG